MTGSNDNVCACGQQPYLKGCNLIWVHQHSAATAAGEHWSGCNLLGSAVTHNALPGLVLLQRRGMRS